MYSHFVYNQINSIDTSDFTVVSTEVVQNFKTLAENLSIYCKTFLNTDKGESESTTQFRSVCFRYWYIV